MTVCMIMAVGVPSCFFRLLDRVVQLDVIMSVDFQNIPMKRGKLFSKALQIIYFFSGPVQLLTILIHK